MSLYSIINPYDKYTIESPSLDVLVMAGILLGQGNYGFQSLDGGTNVIIMAFGGGDEWCQNHFNENLMEMSNRVMDTKLSQVADCLDSVLIGDREDREEFFAVTTNMDQMTFEAHRAIEQEKRCSSINDIGMHAYRLAAKLRKSIEDGIKTLQ